MALVTDLGCVSDDFFVVPNIEDAQAGGAGGEHPLPVNINQTHEIMELHPMCRRPHPGFRNTLGQLDAAQRWDEAGQQLVTPLTSYFSFPRTQFSQC